MFNFESFHSEEFLKLIKLIKLTKSNEKRVSKNNIIDITRHINKGLSKKSQKKGKKSTSFKKALPNDSSQSHHPLSPQFNDSSNNDSSNREPFIASITELRQDTFKKERRQVKRSLLREFIRAQAVVPAKGLLEVYLQDISIDGIAFDIEKERGRFKKGEHIALRVYLTYDTYFPFTVKVRYIRNQSVDGLEVFRHGTSFVKESINSEALVYFAKFIEHATAILRKDKGDIMVSQLV